MKALIIYDSIFGNTQKIARDLAQTLSETLTTHLIPAREATLDVLKEEKILLIGSPTQQYNPTPAVQAFLERIPDDTLQGVFVAAFDTRYRVSHWSSGSAAWIIARLLQHTGPSLIVPPQSFFVAKMEGPLEEGETERARQWATTVLEKVKGIAMAAEERPTEMAEHRSSQEQRFPRRSVQY